MGVFTLISCVEAGNISPFSFLPTLSDYTKILAKASKEIKSFIR
jgi:hypothetical protein